MNNEAITKPIETMMYAAGFAFSHGHFITNAGYDEGYANANVFYWEEQYQAYLAWKAGYQLFIPAQQVIYHLWDRSYRPQFGGDVKRLGLDKKKKLDGVIKPYEKGVTHFEGIKAGVNIRRIMFGDREFIRYMDERWGLDILG